MLLAPLTRRLNYNAEYPPKHLGVSGITIGTDQPGNSSRQLLLNHPHQLLDIGLPASAKDHAQDQSMLRIKGHMIPAISDLLFFQFLLAAPPSLLENKGPLLIQLHLAGLGGKKPAPPGAIAGRATRPSSHS